METRYSHAAPILQKERDHFSFLEGALFLLIIVIESASFFYLMLGPRMVAGHDGFNLFSFYYYFFNNVSVCGEIPQWSPFLMHGTIVSFLYATGGGILAKILCLCLPGSILKYVNIIPFFYIGMFIYELLFLVGLWFWGKRFFSSPFTLFFLSLSAMGSCIWFLQPQYNFHFYYAIPLILYFLHKFLDTGKWRYCLLAGNLLFIQAMGNLPHFLPVVSLVVFLYFLFYCFCSYRRIGQSIKHIKFGWPSVLTAIIVVLPFALLYGYLDFGTSQLVSYGLRGQDGSVPLSQFLTYGGPFSWKRWLELLIGVSPCVDYTLYIGIFCVPFIVLGLVLNINRKNVHFLLTIIVLLLFSMGAFVSTFVYYCWPMMDYYRHLVSVSPIIKLFLCFLAGFGFDAVFFNQSRWKSPAAVRALLAVMSILMFTLCFVLCLLSLNIFSADFIVDMVPENAPPLFLPILNKDLLSFLFRRTALFTLTVPLLFLFFPWIRKKKFFLPLLLFFLFLHGADIYSFKFIEMNLKTIPLTDEMYKITEFQPMPYAKRRDLSFTNNNYRVELLEYLPVIVNTGSFYWTVHAFCFQDQLGSPFRADFWMLPLDQYMKAYWGQPINDRSVKPRGLFYLSKKEYPRLDFPKEHPAVLKISGVTEDKIQFFSEAIFVTSEKKIASLITSPEYAGDMIFLSPLDDKEKTDSENLKKGTAGKLSVNRRLCLSYQVERFDSNHLVVTAQNNQGARWLFYSDAWHPLWRARVNGEETPVYRANLAYKAVRLEPGLNTVHFYFKSGFVSFAHYVFGVNSLVWLVIIVFLAGRIVLNRGDVWDERIQIKGTGWG